MHEPVDKHPQSPRGRRMTILFADMADYSRHAESDEARTLDFMSRCLDTFRILTRRHGCDLVKTLGDGALVVFEDPQPAIDYAVDFLRIVERLQREVAQPYSFRIGIHSGEVVEFEGDVMGNAVNVSQRVLTQAPPGGLMITEEVYRALAEDSRAAFRHIGAPVLRHIATRHSLYELSGGAARADASATLKPMRVSVIGVPRLLGGSDVEAVVEDPDARALLVYLALCPGRLDSLSRLGALFQQGDDTAAARAAVEAAAEKLAQLGVAFVSVEPGWLALDNTAVETDLELAEVGLRRGEIAPLLLETRDWPDRILPDAGNLPPAFANWLRVTREDWKSRMLRGLAALIEQGRPQDERFAHAADAILLLEPGNEVASVARVSHNLAAGNHAAAKAELDRLQTYLSATFGSKPQTAIRDAIQSALSGKWQQGMAGLPNAVPRRRMLRIEVLSSAEDPADTYRTSAFRAELVANLARIRDWSVIEVAEGGGSAGPVDFRISCDAMSGGDDPQLVLRLRRMPDARVLWSDRVPLGSGSWDHAQRTTLYRITIELESYISADRLTASRAPYATEKTLHDSWLRGDNAMMSWTPAGLDKAREIFTAVLREDADHVPSLTSLASMSNIQHLVWPGRQRSAEETREADRLASRAVSIDPMDSRVHRVVAWTASFEGAFDRASLHLDRALDLNPHSPVALASCALGYAWFGEADKADIALTRLQTVGSQLAPWLWSYLSVTCYFLDRLGDARKAAEMSDDQIIDNQGWVAAIEARRGNMAEAQTAFARMVERVTPLWQGEAAASPTAIGAWFTNAFPINHAADRDKLKAPIEAILARR